ncbi:MAG: toprim domain-containing protein, partial [Pseudonocardiales bacterium]
GRKPAGDTNPDNPKYLNPTSTPLYDKSRVLYGQDAEAIAKLHNGARAIIVEGPMDRLAIQLAADQTGMDLVPVATCGSALTDAHLDLLAQHTALDHVILGFDADAAGRKASIAAGKKLAARGVATPDVELFTAPAGADPADILANDGAELLAATLTDPQHHATLLELLVDDQLDQYDWSSSGFPLRELPIASHAAHQATRLVADTVRERVTWGPAYAEQIQRQLTRIAERTGIDAAELNNHMIGVAFPDDYDGDAVAELDRAAAAGIDLAVHGAEPELELRSDVGGEYQIEEVADADADRF